MIRKIIIIGFCLPFIFACDKKESETKTNTRKFKMGFTTWTYDATVAAREDTYHFIMNNADIYSEQFDEFIPWNAWINNTTLPDKFLNDVNYRASKITQGKDILLSVSLLNIDRNNLLPDVDGSLPTITAMNDVVIEDAYVKHLNYLISRFNPKYLVLAMEVNEMLVRVPAKWPEYKLLMTNVRQRIKAEHPNLLLSESITLHNFFNPDVPNQAAFIEEISNYANQLDFVAISFYPYLRNWRYKNEYQLAFDFLHTKITKPIAFVETAYMAEDLVVAAYNLNMPSNETLQNDYLQTLLDNASSQNYLFLIWWTHRDYDALWQIFPENVKDLGKLWKDTGLLDENGKARMAYDTWQEMLEK